MKSDSKTRPSKFFKVNFYACINSTSVFWKIKKINSSWKSFKTPNLYTKKSSCFPKSQRLSFPTLKILLGIQTLSEYPSLALKISSKLSLFSLITSKEEKLPNIKHGLEINIIVKLLISNFSIFWKTSFLKIKK